MLYKLLSIIGQSPRLSQLFLQSFDHSLLFSQSIVNFLNPYFSRRKSFQYFLLLLLIKLLLLFLLIIIIFLILLHLFLVLFKYKKLLLLSLLSILNILLNVIIAHFLRFSYINLKIKFSFIRFKHSI